MRPQVRGPNPSRRNTYVPPAAGTAAPSSATTSPSASAITVPMTHAKYACGPARVCRISAIAMNGPMPTMLDMFTVVALSRVSLRCMQIPRLLDLRSTGKRSISTGLGVEAACLSSVPCS